ncbi:MAG: hypothetical protein OXF61_07640 [Acidimicrobiaceae bacterium]|nr:hypothetical protein [Acidimicrobiaceae bacterium]
MPRLVGSIADTAGGDAAMSAEVWSGRDYYVMLGTRDDRKRWLLARQYNFLNDGSGRRRWTPLRHLEPDDWVFAYVAGHGYVGIGVVMDEMQHIRDATVTVEGEEVPLIDQPGIDPHFREAATSDDEDVLEMVIQVKWKSETYDFDDAFWEPRTGLFWRRNTVCELTDQNTIDRVLAAFDLDRD